MPSSHICRFRVSDPQAPLPFTVQCDICSEAFLPIVIYSCNCEGLKTFLLCEKVRTGDGLPCPIHHYTVDITHKAGLDVLIPAGHPVRHPASDDRNERRERKKPRSFPETIDVSKSTNPDIGRIQLNPAPFLDSTAKIGLSVLALVVLIPLLIPILSQIALAGVLLGLLGVVLFWVLYEILARLLLWPFRDWRSASQPALAAAAPAPALAARRWIQRHSLLLFLVGFVCGALTVALIAETFESARATILQLATVSGASVALASVLFYAGTAAAPNVTKWLRARGRKGYPLTTERAALWAGLTRALPLGIATVIVLAFAPALLQPVFSADFPLAVQAAIGLVINVIGSIVILLSEAVTKHLWPDASPPRGSHP